MCQRSGRRRPGWTGREKRRDQVKPARAFGDGREERWRWAGRFPGDDARGFILGDKAAGTRYRYIEHLNVPKRV